MSGFLLFKMLAVLISAFLLADLVGWLMGESLSQLIIKLKSRYMWFRVLLIAFIVVLAALLVSHFELLQW